MSRTKVLMLANSPGGVKRHVADIAGALDPARYEVVGLFPDRSLAGDVAMGVDNSYHALFARLGLATEVVELPRSLRPLQDLRALLSVIRSLRRHRPDVLHCHSSMPGVVGRVAALFCRPRVVAYTPNLMFYQRFPGLKGRIFYWLERLLAPFTDAIVAVSASEYERISRDFGARRVVRVNNSLPLPPLPDGSERASVLAELGLAESARLILSPARLDTQKDVATLVAAMGRVHALHPQAVALLAGDGELRPQVEAQAARLGLGSAVRFLGWRDDVHRLMAAADVVVLSTHLEGCPYALLEAAALARPILASDVQGARDCVRHGESGYLFPQGDAATLAARLGELLADPALAVRMGMAGREYIRREFNLADMIAAKERIYAGTLP